MAWQRKTPFGYIVQGGETVPCPAEADAVQDIFTRYLAGATYNEIAERMSRGNTPYHQHTAGAITEFDEITVRQLVSNIKVVSKDTLLICFKDGTEVTQTMENTGRASA